MRTFATDKEDQITQRIDTAGGVRPRNVRAVGGCPTERIEMFLAIDENGTETVFEDAPYIAATLFVGESATWDTNGKYKILESGSIEKLIGRKITFEDGYIEYNGTIDWRMIM